MRSFIQLLVVLAALLMLVSALETRSKVKKAQSPDKKTGGGGAKYPMRSWKVLSSPPMASADLAQREGAVEAAHAERGLLGLGGKKAAPAGPAPDKGDGGEKYPMRSWRQKKRMAKQIVRSSRPAYR